MINYREILRLNSLGYSQRRIEASVHSSHQTVKNVLEKASAQGISWPLEDDITNAILGEMLSDRNTRTNSPYAEPDFAYIHKELSKKGVTLTLLWQEYCEKCRTNGQQPYMSTQFGDKYRRWARVTKATMRITHKPGDAMQVDWAGETIPYYDTVTGEEYKAYLFVAALPCSCYIYTEACGDMKQENWLLCHVHAYEYFGGVARLLIPDNLKTGVIANTRYETRLNESYRELAEYYGTAVVPARVRKPRDKSIVEKSAGFSTTWITAAMRERKFFSLAEVKAAVAERLEIINTMYEPAVWKQATVRNDYLVSDGQNKYSVPFDLIGEQVQIRLTKNTVEVFFKGDRVASHQRLAGFQTQPVVKPEHMPEKHRMYLRYNTDDFRAWAKTVGDSTETVMDHFLKSGSSPEQGYKNCVTLMKLGEKNGKEKLEYACERMLELSSVPSIRTIAVILKNGKEPERKTTSPADSEKYGITRGAAYFKKGGDRNA